MQCLPVPVSHPPFIFFLLRLSLSVRCLLSVSARRTPSIFLSSATSIRLPRLGVPRIASASFSSWADYPSVKLTSEEFCLEEVTNWEELCNGRSYTWEELYLGGSRDIPVPHYLSPRPSYRRSYTWEESCTGRSYTLGRAAHWRCYALGRFTN